jgi:hypothetical protein
MLLPTFRTAKPRVTVFALRYSGHVVKPELIVHCDWSTSATKRWLAAAQLSPKGSYEAAGLIPVGSTNSFFSRLREKVPIGPILAGFDFPIGVPRAYAERAGFGRFPEMLLCLGNGPWADFYNPAVRPDEISLVRPFYPRTPGGTRKQQLLDGLGLCRAEELLRRCDRRTAARGNACEIFWILGANQVGRAAIQGWRDVLAPAVRSRSISIWPFDGELRVLLASAGITVLEAYPAETYGHLGLSRGFGKRSREGRSSQARTILFWCERNAVVLQPELAANIENGFGDSETGEDAFDAFIGLLGIIEAVCDPSRCEAPQDPAVRDIEGWILGTDPASLGAPPVMPTRSAHSLAAKEFRRETTTAKSPAEEGRGRLCPACQQKRFARWPWGWDGHAAHVCTGITGDTPEDRKRAYRERYLG